MIVFAIAFGQKYIDALAATCLPSLFGETNYKGSIKEPIELLVYTTRAWAAEVERALSTVDPGVMHHFSLAKVVTGNVPTETPYVTAARLLILAIERCGTQTFAVAVPDLIYAANTLENCYKLHKITGKVVAIFDGRVRPDVDPKECLGASSGNLTQFFLKHCDDMWRAHTTSDLDAPPGPKPGHMIFKDAGQCWVFVPRVTPFVGEFMPIDSLILKDSIGSWDHGWADFLELNNRMLVQTSLLEGFAIEPSPKNFIALDIDLRSSDENVLRQFKFQSSRVYCFTG